jgi:hypothetical protein
VEWCRQQDIPVLGVVFLPGGRAHAER